MKVPYPGPVEIPAHDGWTTMWALSSHSATNDSECYRRFIQSPKCETKDCPWHTWYGNGTHQDDIFTEQLRIYCFTCAFWHRMAEADKDGKGVITENYKHYRLPNKLECIEPAALRGFGGRRFVIQMGLPGPIEEVETNDLWHQGTIPENMRMHFKPNARFV